LPNKNPVAHDAHTAQEAQGTCIITNFLIGLIALTSDFWAPKNFSYTVATKQGCALAEPRGLRLLTFVFRPLKKLIFLHDA